MPSLRRAFAAALFTVLPALRAADAPPVPLVLRPGDHIAILGSALADRQQHSGYLETLLVAAHPTNDLVIRNLALAGDEVATWHRSENFGTRDEWLTKVKADVILAYYGYGESFRGRAGLEKFRADLDQFIQHTRAQNYSGKGAPRLVLVSPTAEEPHPDPNFPDPADANARLQDYTYAMAQLAKANQIPFVNLFSASQELYAKAASAGKPLTVNGHYFSAAGDRLLAPILFKSLFGSEPPPLNEKLHASINEKNHQWFLRYRTVDGYNVYGGRSALAYQPGKGDFISDRQPKAPFVSNFQTMQQEMSQRDVLTANRDRRVWAVARGGDLAVDDSNLPPVAEVKSNKPGPNADESHVFLSGEAAIAKMTVHSGMKVNLFADEAQFPDLIKPVQMAWDAKGRLWVAAWRNYPERAPTSKIGDKLLVLEDTDGDGRADRVTTFLDDLNAPTGFQFYQDGVLQMQAPDLWFARDTDGDGRADWKERVLMGMDSADSHHTANAICLDPGGAIYLSDGVFHRTQVETAHGITRNEDAAIFRFEPRTGKFETYIAYGFANPHGRVFDAWGNDLVTDATGNNTYFGPAISGRLDYPHKHSGIKEFWPRPSRPCPGTGMLSSRHFPDEFQGNFLNCNVIGFQGIYRVRVSEDGSGLKGETLENIVSSTDPNFRPSAVNIGPDGAIYFADWHSPLIGHMQHHLRDPNRDQVHGRIYRITWPERPLLKPKPIAGQPIEALLELLKEPEDNVRERAKIELGARDTAAVIAATKKWTTALDVASPNYAHDLLEALWVHQWHNVVDVPLLQRVLALPEPRARAAAGRVLCYWRDRVPDALALFRKLAEDEAPRVRLEAVRAASFFPEAAAVEVALAALKRPLDYYLDYTLGETLRQLDPVWRKAIADGKSLAADNPAGLQRLFAKLTTPELLKLPRSEGMQFALLARADLPETTRHELLASLANLRHSSRAAVLLSAIDAFGARDRVAAAQFARLLPLQPDADLKPERACLSQLARGAEAAEVRQAAWAALAAADGSLDKIWQEAAGPDAFADLLGGLPLLFDQALRDAAYDRVKPLLNSKELPPAALQSAIRVLAGIPRDPAEAFGVLAGLIAGNREVPAAANALRLLPRASWPKPVAGATATALVKWARNIPAAERTSQAYAETVQIAEDLAGFLPAEAAGALRRELRGLRVAVFVIRTVREQMRYDTPRLVVEAGKPFQIIFENGDFMPHNLVVMKPGARANIGPQTETMRPDQLDDQGRAFLPSSPDILGGTKLLEPGQRAALSLTAPKEEGDCEYVCTYPGHWTAMWGQLIVTRDVDAYLRAHPEAPVPAADTTHHHSTFE